MDTLRLDIKPIPQGTQARAEAPVQVKQTPPKIVNETEVASNPKHVEEEALDQKSIDKARFEAVAKAAKVVGDYFVVSDVKFTIFKDIQGQYITRFTSLKDGSVSYYPEAELLKTYSAASGESLSVLDTEV